jgi:hypothetical protein
VTFSIFSLNNGEFVLERVFMGNPFRPINTVHLQTTRVFILWFDLVDLASTVQFSATSRESDEFHGQSPMNRMMIVLERVLIADERIPDSLPNRCMIAHVVFDSPALPATLRALKFASRVQDETSDDIRNLKDHKANQIRRLQNEIDDIRDLFPIRSQYDARAASLADEGAARCAKSDSRGGAWRVLCLHGAPSTETLIEIIYPS